MQIDELPAGEQNQCPDMDMNKKNVQERALSCLTFLSVIMRKKRIFSQCY